MQMYFISWTRITRIYRIFSLYAKLFMTSVRFVFKQKLCKCILFLEHELYEFTKYFLYMLNYSWHLWDSCSNKSYANVFYFLNTKQSSLKAIIRIYRIFSLYAKLFVTSVRFVFPPPKKIIISFFPCRNTISQCVFC